MDYNNEWIYQSVRSFDFCFMQKNCDFKGRNGSKSC